MGIIRLTLFTMVLLWLGMKYFGRDEGLSGHLIGREAEPVPVTVVMEEPAAPDAAPALAPLGDSATTAEPTSTVSATEPDATGSDGFDAAAGIVAEINNAAQQAVDSTTQPSDAPATQADSAPDTQPTPAAESAQDEIILPAEDDPSFMPTPEPAPALPAQLFVTGTKVNVRSDPSTTNEPIAALTRGTEVIDLGDVGDNWRQIQLQSGEIGFMSNDFLSPTAP